MGMSNQNVIKFSGSNVLKTYFTSMFCCVVISIFDYTIISYYIKRFINTFAVRLKLMFSIKIGIRHKIFQIFRSFCLFLILMIQVCNCKKDKNNETISGKAQITQHFSPIQKTVPI